MNKQENGATEAQLMKAVASGDQPAFARLVELHLPAIHHYAQRLSGSRADADDLAQDTFVAARTRARSFRARRGRLSTWLHRIAHNLWIDQVRRQRTAGSAAEPVAEGPDREAESADRAERLNAALAELPENQRCAIVLCAQQGLSNAEAARVLGTSVRALESLLARARRQLREKLADTL